MRAIRLRYCRWVTLKPAVPSRLISTIASAAIGGQNVAWERVGSVVSVNNEASVEPTANGSASRRVPMQNARQENTGRCSRKSASR